MRRTNAMVPLKDSDGRRQQWTDTRTLYLEEMRELFQIIGQHFTFDFHDCVTANRKLSWNCMGCGWHSHEPSLNGALAAWFTR